MNEKNTLKNKNLQADTSSKWDILRDADWKGDSYSTDFAGNNARGGRANYDRKYVDLFGERRIESALEDKQYLIQTYNGTRVAEIIRLQHPEMDKLISYEEEVYIGSNYDELAKKGTISRDFAFNVMTAYERTQNPTLMRIARQLAPRAYI